jgi:GT2 family glycosyltransferase
VDLRTLVEGILERTDYEPVEVIVVARENSDAETLNYLDQLQRDLRIRVLSCNSSFSLSALYDLGVRQAEGELIGLLSNDLRIVSPDWLGELVSHALRPDIGAVGAKIVDENDSIQHAGIILGLHGVAGYAFKNFSADSEGYVFRAQVTQNYSAVSGGCLLLRREVFAEVGGFDEENFPSLFIDIDLCLRIRRLGLRILWTPYAKLNRLTSSQVAGAAEKDKSEHERAVRNFQLRWQGVLADRYYNPNLTLASEDFSPAFPPRARKPWQEPG